MKKFIFTTLALLSASVIFAAQTCQRSDIACYESGPSGNLSTIFRIDASGNVTTLGGVTVTGSETVSGTSTMSGVTVYTPTFASLVSSITVTTPASTYLVVSSTATNGGSVTCGASVYGGPGSTSAVPCISTATATNGQYLVISSTQAASVGTVTFSSSTTSGMDLGSATRVIQYGKTLSLIFDSASGQWREVAYGNN